MFGPRLQYWLRKISNQLDEIQGVLEEMAVDQATFDEHLTGLISAVNELTAAVESWAASREEVDFTADDEAVQNAAASVQAALDKLQSVPVPTQMPAPDTSLDAPTPPEPPTGDTPDTGLVGEDTSTAGEGDVIPPPTPPPPPVTAP